LLLRTVTPVASVIRRRLTGYGVSFTVDIDAMGIYFKIVLNQFYVRKISIYLMGRLILLEHQKNKPMDVTEKPPFASYPL